MRYRGYGGPEQIEAAEVPLPRPGPAQVLVRVAASILLPLWSKRRVRSVSVKPRGEDLEELRALCDAGKLRPVIGRSFRLEELAAAHACSRQGAVAGKIAIEVRNNG